MSNTAAIYAAHQAANPESTFNENLIYWREQDDAAGYLEDVFAALEVVPGITFLGVDIIRDENQFPDDITFNDIEMSRLDLAKVRFRVEKEPDVKEITLHIFLPKLIDGLFYVLNDSLYYPILQLVDRGTYVTKKTFTLKTLLMPLVFRRDVHATTTDCLTGQERTDMVYTLDLFRYQINVMRYFMANRGLAETLRYFSADRPDLPHDDTDQATHARVAVMDREAIQAVKNAAAEYAAFDIEGSSGLCVVAERAWLEADQFYRGGLVASLVDSLNGIQKRYIEEDDVAQWKRRLGRHFTQNSNAFEEKAEKILVSLERILDRRTRRNLAHVAAADKVDVYSILRWMMREYRTLASIDGMDITNKRIRVSEYLVHPLLLKFSESTYRLLNDKNLTFKKLMSIFRAFVHDEEAGQPRSQVNFLVRKLVTNELLRYVNLVNSFDLLLALRFTFRGPQSLADRGKADVALRFRGHHPSYVGRVGLSAASASDPGMSGTLVPFVATSGQFFL